MSMDQPTSEPTITAPLPSEVEFILSALDAGQYQTDDRRAYQRQAYRVRALLRLFSDLEGTPPWLLYSRDVTPRSLGFVTPHRLPLGYGGVIELPDPTGQVRKVECTLLRCREAVAGWFEGALYFNRDQLAFDLGQPAVKGQAESEM